MHWWYFCSRKYIYINNKRVDCLSDTSELQWRKCLCCYLHTSLSPLYLTCYPAAHETISAKAADDPLFSLCTAQHCLNATQLRHRVQTQTKLLGEDRLHQQCKTSLAAVQSWKTGVYIKSMSIYCTFNTGLKDSWPQELDYIWVQNIDFSFSSWYCCCYVFGHVLRLLGCVSGSAPRHLIPSIVGDAYSRMIALKL